MIGLPIFYYNQLPDLIPQHFDINGEPDAFNKKSMIWVLVAIGVLTYLGMAWLLKKPHLFNFPQQVTEENAERLYKSATRMIRILNTLIACLFAYITYGIIHTALGHQNGLGSYLLPIILIATLGITVYFFVKTYKK